MVETGRAKHPAVYETLKSTLRPTPGLTKGTLDACSSGQSSEAAVPDSRMPHRVHVMEICIVIC